MVVTNYGKMEGVDHGSYIEYRRVPYAKAPVGDLRFRAPQKPEAWEGVYQAVDYAPKCMQLSYASEPYDKDFYSDPAYDREMSEDCLYLNLWVPKHNLDGTALKDAPVAMWIHGGGFMGGYATESEFDGESYCDRGVILASVEYRCNAFGFLAHPWLTREDENHSSGNYGILDQIAALTWIYENISCFGGDPNNITVFGQSAGAMSTQTLVTSPLTRGMIAKAIMQSGGSYGTGLHQDRPLELAEYYGELFVEILGVSSLEELRKVSSETILGAVFPWMQAILAEGGQNNISDTNLPIVPAIDNYVIHDGYYKTMDAGNIMDIPYIIGCNSNDFGIMEKGNLNPIKKSSLYQGSIDFGKKVETLGYQPSYVYYFKRNLPGDDWGAYHSAELFYMFGTLHRTWRPWETLDRKLSEQMLDNWAAFMRTGDPNGTGEVKWRPYRKQDPCIRIFDVENIG